MNLIQDLKALRYCLLLTNISRQLPNKGQKHLPYPYIWQTKKTDIDLKLLLLIEI